ncbi:hypothetical protein [Oceanitalea stevensii]|uniref:DUF222 domain-containing protein n=1 Tax=Oceanitalea stevensii TaxID=2763072 RepID=A0ABR8YZ99_9MICO|nr:hypothetical protein [Oceanitalea stevensii]MBD8061407.1 hypothetical protein [Oceanitalea stevensii]
MTTTTSPTGPAPLARQVRAGVAALLSGAPGTGAGGWTGEEREAVVAELDAAIQELTVYRGQVLLAHRNDGRWGSVQDRDFADYRSRSTGIGRGAAVGDLRLAEGLEAMPAVAGAVERGEVTLEHARALTRLREKAARCSTARRRERGSTGSYHHHRVHELDVVITTLPDCAQRRAQQAVCQCRRSSSPGPRSASVGHATTWPTPGGMSCWHPGQR